MKNIFGVWVITALFLTSMSIAQIRNVPSQYTTIQAAIDDCNDGDEVVIASGTYTGTGNRDIDFLGKAITVRGATGDPNDCIIDCNGSPSERHRGFYFHSGEDANSVLDGLTVKNGYADRGAGISISNSSPTTRNCVITACSVELIPDTIGFCLGGGIYIGENSSSMILNCVISGNTAGEFGLGAGVYSNSVNTPLIRNCVISGNKTAGFAGKGGGIFSEYSMTITNCTIVENKAFDEGGGIWCGQDTKITNCIVWNNHDDEIYSIGSPKVQYSDVKNGYPGLGNISVDPCFVNIATVLTADFDSSGEVDFRDFAEFAAKWQMQSIDAGFNAQYDISIPADDVINELDLFVFANQWLSSTNLAGSDYHLKSKGYRWDVNTEQWTWDNVNSRCIDAGMPGMSLGDELLAVEEDPDNALSGNLRIDMGAYGGTAQASLGHYSFTTTWSRLCDVTNDGIVDFSDFVVMANDFGLESTEIPFPADFDRDGQVGLSDIVIFAQDWLETATWH